MDDLFTLSNYESSNGANQWFEQQELLNARNVKRQFCI